MTRYLSRVTFIAALLAAGGCGSTVVAPPPPVDGGVVCRFPDGTECRPGQSCPSPDGCNTCGCSGDGVLACTARACVDGGPPDVSERRACVSSADCPGGEECHIVEGCATPSYCGPLLGRQCSGDLTPYCGCDGRTFNASSTCPTRTYENRGPCGAVDAGSPADGGASCAPMDAVGEGLCDGYFGVAWNGSACVSITGCRCVGADCPRAYRDREECVAACGG